MARFVGGARFGSQLSSIIAPTTSLYLHNLVNKEVIFGHKDMTSTFAVDYYCR
jgi:hypothetical protein